MLQIINTHLGTSVTWCGWVRSVSRQPTTTREPGHAILKIDVKGHARLPLADRLDRASFATAAYRTASSLPSTMDASPGTAWMPETLGLPCELNLWRTHSRYYAMVAAWAWILPSLHFVPRCLATRLRFVYCRTEGGDEPEPAKAFHSQCRTSTKQGRSHVGPRVFPGPVAVAAHARGASILPVPVSVHHERRGWKDSCFQIITPIHRKLAESPGQTQRP